MDSGSKIGTISKEIGGVPINIPISILTIPDTKEWSVYLELAEELNMRILEIVAQAGTSLSLPARTLHIEQTDGSGKAAIA